MRPATENPTSDSESASSTILVPQVSWKSLTFDKTAVIKSHRINPSDRHGNTPLVDAVRNKNFQCIDNVPEGLNYYWHMPKLVGT